jgi:hypothetical protein
MIRCWSDGVTSKRAAYKQRETLIGELEKMLTPPAPPPEPITEVVVVEEDQGPPKLGYPDLRRWF